MPVFPRLAFRHTQKSELYHALCNASGRADRTWYLRCVFVACVHTSLVPTSRSLVLLEREVP